MAKIPVALLVEHPENKLFHNLSDEELQELAKDMQENGLIHAVVARTAGEQYQIISGHQRVRAAKLLGWTDIETDVLDVDDNKAARMLISANVKTRTLSPMELAKAIRREKELIEQTYGNRERKRTDLTAAHHEPQLEGRWSEQVSQEIGKSEQHIRRLDKLNELIPELQQLVDQGKLGTTAAEQLAYLEPETQQALFASLGEEISLRTVAQTKELRKRLEEAQAKDRQTEELQQELARLQQMGRLEDKQQIARLQSEIQRLQNQPPEQIEVVPEAVKNELAVWKKRVSEVEQEKREKEDALRKKEEELAFF
ncbi:ParB/RepB/Spo0J family partition protein, partial [Sulfoacidibacillus thermotolerans]